MAYFTINGYRIFIEDGLRDAFNNVVVQDLLRKDMDAVYLVDGEERSGKSVFAMSIASYVACALGTKFNESNVCMTPQELREKIVHAKKNESIVYDEAHRGMGSSSALSEINRIMKDLMMEMGQKNLFLIIVLPSFFMLEKYAAIHRARGLFHIYKNRGERGYWVYFNKKRKQILYIYGKREMNYSPSKQPKWPNGPGKRGRFRDGYPINEAKYRQKKLDAFKFRPRFTKSEKFKEQRDNMVFCLYKEGGLGIYDIEALCKRYKIGLKKSQILDIVKEKQSENDVVS